VRTIASALTPRGGTEYGDKDNSDLAGRFSIKADDFPQYRLWPKGSAGSAEPLKFAGDKAPSALGAIARQQHTAG
jgi:hypothetical protein